MFKDKLQEVMALRGLSPYDLSKISGVSVSGIYDLLNGVNTDPRSTTIEKLSKALGISPNYFFEEHTMGPEKLLAKLSPEDRDLVLSDEFLPFITLGRKAIENEIPPEQIELVLKAIVYNAHKK